MQGKRGEIQNRKRAKQLRDYSRIRFGNITPTDIDGLIDFGGVWWVIFELKVKSTEVSYGQRLALERLCDDLQKSDKDTYLLIAEHDQPVDVDIDAYLCNVTQYRHKGRWKKPKTPISLGVAIDKLHSISLNKNKKA